eukprot:CAMPEP_0202693678 /NCGR_PEP_ID=MMETSP1385-20130828/7709_1 /ASSEMBLY_ACC=CAM_ASM_000861 /TAXON_ID=933848 /ORGANISM="Elphidium margaritaceum" /LENGTH=570 /DNA_ID=CAMNT_0049349387 /DNA_START=53 /DNA_END=1765 /DNA_ORIENTATION=-
MSEIQPETTATQPTEQPVEQPAPEASDSNVFYARKELCGFTRWKVLCLLFCAIFIPALIVCVVLFVQYVDIKPESNTQFHHDKLSSAGLQNVEVTNVGDADSHRIIEIYNISGEVAEQRKIEFQCFTGDRYEETLYTDYFAQETLQVFSAHSTEEQVICVENDGEEQGEKEKKVCMIFGKDHSGSPVIYQVAPHIGIHEHSMDELKGMAAYEDSDNVVELTGIDELPLPGDLQLFLDELAEVVDGLIVTAFKLAMGGDENSCSTQIKVWAMAAYKSHHHDDYEVYEDLIHQTNCINEVRADPSIDNNDAASIDEALSSCMNAFESSRNARRLQTGALASVNTYTCPQVENFLSSNQNCPEGSRYLRVPGDPGHEYLGQCGPEGTAWNFVCGASEYNGGFTDGCNNGCFEHDYYCGCTSLGYLHPLCASFVTVFTVDKICHAGSTCLTIHQVYNLGSITDSNDPWWGRGDPYVYVLVDSPSNSASSLWTDYYDDWSYSGWTSYNGMDNSKCWSMRVSTFKFEIWDDDYDYDDLIAGPYYVTNPMTPGSTTTSTVGGSAIIHYTIENRFSSD